MRTRIDLPRRTPAAARPLRRSFTVPIQRAGDGDGEREREEALRELPWGGRLPLPPPAPAPPHAGVPSPAPPSPAPIAPENLDPVDRVRDALGSGEAADRFIGQTLLAQRRATTELKAIGDDSKTVASTADPLVPFVSSSDQLRGRPGFYHPGASTAQRFRRIEDLATRVGHPFHGTPSQPVSWAKLHAEPTLLELQTAPAPTPGVPLTPTQRSLPTGVSRTLCTVGGGPGNCEGLYRADADRGDHPRAIGDPTHTHFYAPRLPPLHVPHNRLLVRRLPGPADLEASQPAEPLPVPVPDLEAPRPAPDPRRQHYLKATQLLGSSLSSPSDPARLEAARRLAAFRVGTAAPEALEETFHQGLGLLTRTVRERQPFAPSPGGATVEPPIELAPPTPHLPIGEWFRRPHSAASTTPEPSRAAPVPSVSFDSRRRAPKRPLVDTERSQRSPEAKRQAVGDTTPRRTETRPVPSPPREAPPWGGHGPASASPFGWGVNHPLHLRFHRDDEGAV
jgi:hypothetical protein